MERPRNTMLAPGLCVLAVALLTAGAARLYSRSATASCVLDHPIPALRLEVVRLQDAIESLQEVSGVRFEVNWAGLARAYGVHLDSPITIYLNPGTLRQALDVLAGIAHGQMTYYEQTGVVHIGVADPLASVVQVYDVRDLIDAQIAARSTERAWLEFSQYFPNVFPIAVPDDPRAREANAVAAFFKEVADTDFAPAVVDGRMIVASSPPGQERVRAYLHYIRQAQACWRDWPRPPNQNDKER